jgi:hypothetical protein
MPLEITREPNDDLVVRLFGVKYVNVYYNEMAAPGKDFLARPTSAVVFVAPTSALPHDQIDENTDRLLKEWAARKTGCPAGEIDIEGV